MWIITEATPTMAEQLAEIRELLMSNQDKINSITSTIAGVRDLVVKIHAEIQHIKANPPAEGLDFSRLDDLLQNLKDHTTATDAEIPDLPAAA
ncbi:hypothetical protein NONI108955_20865 [Nocardia ninae]|uniref:Uncharacterized protein n=1 Tax=Nocardia ninae NBRC 108245 TaxID=1210091 RepID=A0A511MB42_9NOCA|nr:hypothetical protein [Nocardia ninae]GEM37407.1 hypothetical protein NN4_19260 [Nocardia ninae NBRC 108245]